MEGDLRVFRGTQRPVGVIYPVKALNASWVLNGGGALTFSMPVEPIRWSTEYIDAMNLVEFHCAELPYAWVGAMVSDKPSGADGTVTCVDATSLLKKRYTEEFVQFIGTSGDIAEGLLRQALRRGPLGKRLTVGTVDRSGPQYYRDFQRAEVAKSLDDLAGMTGAAWWIELSTHGWLDPWRFMWSRTRGVNRSGSVIVSGEVNNDPEMEHQSAELATAAHVYGVEYEGQKMYTYVPNDGAIQRYGLLETSLDFPEVIDPVLLNEAGVRGLEKLSRPTRPVGINIDNRYGVWGSFWLGDYIRAILYGQDFVGYDGPVRVLGIQLDADKDTLGLTVEVPL